MDRSGLFQGAFGKRYAFYSVATDLAGNREPEPTTPDAFTTVTRTNRAPLLEPIANRAVREGETLVIQAVASDPDGDALVFSLSTNAPPGVVLNPYTGLITWATGEGSGPAEVKLTLQVLDTGLPRLGAVRTFTLAVSDENSPPILQPLAGRTVREGQSLLITNQVTDPDLPKQRLTFSMGSGAPTAPPSIRSPACSPGNPPRIKAANPIV